MRPKFRLVMLTAFILASVHLAHAQQPKKIPRIGYLAPRSEPGANEKAFLQGLQSLGYIEAQTIAIEWRFAHEKLDRLPDLANELVGLKVDVIVASGGYPSVQAVKKATITIPIVMTNVNDAVGLGLVASLARPGGNVTGLSALSPELSGKQLELLKETIPKASRVAVLTNPSGPNWKLNIKEIEPQPGRWACNFKSLRCAGRTILTAHFNPRNDSAQRLSSFRHPGYSRLLENALSRSFRKVVCRRSAVT
jgi:putative tryptophan/tyrosine transport system substrate-binding protein